MGHETLGLAAQTSGVLGLCSRVQGHMHAWQSADECGQHRVVSAAATKHLQMSPRSPCTHFPAHPRMSCSNGSSGWCHLHANAVQIHDVYSCMSGGHVTRCCCCFVGTKLVQCHVSSQQCMRPCLQLGQRNP